MTAAQLIQDDHPPHLARGDQEERQADHHDHHRGAERQSEAAPDSENHGHEHAHDHQGYDAPDLHRRGEPQQPAGHHQGRHPMSSIVAGQLAPAELADHQRHGHRQTEVGEPFGERGALDENGSRKDRVEAPADDGRDLAQPEQRAGYDEAGEAAHRHPDQPRHLPSRRLTDPPPQAGDRAQGQQHAGRMEEQEVLVRKSAVDQTDRPGVVDGVVVAEHAGRAGAAQHRQQAIRGCHDEDDDEDRHRAERLGSTAYPKRLDRGRGLPRRPATHDMTLARG